MQAQEVCDQYANGLFGQKYLGGITEFMIDFERSIMDPVYDNHKDKIDSFRKDFLEAVDLSWVRTDGPLVWDSVPEIKEAIEKYLEGKKND